MGEPEWRDGAWWHRQPDGTELRWDDEEGRWRPAPGSWIPELPAAPEQEPYEAIGGRARAARALLFCIAGLCVVATVSSAFEWRLLQRIVEGKQVSDAAVNFNDIRQGIIGLLQFGLYIACAVLFIMWIFRAYKNLPRLGSTRLRYHKGWAIGGWFVPILSLWRPKQIVNDVWRASDPDLPAQAGERWKENDIPRALFGAWWALYLVSQTLGNFAFRAGLGDDTPEELRDVAAVTTVSDALDIPAALLAAAIVGRVTRRQEERARRLQHGV